MKDRQQGTNEPASRRLEQWLLERTHARAHADTHADALKTPSEGEGEIPPLPSTRALGAQFGVSHATAFRLLQKLEREGLVWRAENGRFFPTTVRRYVENVLPVACLIRQLQDWFSLCRQVMEGFTSECAEGERPLLLIQRRELLVQKGAHAPVQIADVAMQGEVLRDFCRIYRERVCGLLLDELWDDRAIATLQEAEMLPPTVLFFRRSEVQGVGNVYGDFAAAALLGLSHLLACGYGPIYLVRPFEGYAPAQTLLAEARALFQQLTGQVLPEERVLDLQDAGAIRKVVALLQAGEERIGFFCPEDNASLYLLEQLRGEGLAVPEAAGILSCMGTSLVASGEVTSVQFDFRRMGERAAQMLLSGEIGREAFAPELRLGATTRA